MFVLGYKINKTVGCRASADTDNAVRFDFFNDIINSSLSYCLFKLVLIHVIPHTSWLSKLLSQVYGDLFWKSESSLQLRYFQVIPKQRTGV